MIWSYLTRPSGWIVLVVVAAVGLFFNPFCGGEDETAETETPVSTLPVLRPTLTSPPNQPNLSEDLPAPTTTTTIEEDPDRVVSCRAAVLSDDFLKVLEEQAASVQETTRQWDAREIRYSATKKAVEEWLEETKTVLGSSPDLPFAVSEDDEEIVEEWLEELEDTADSVLEWLVASGNASTVKRREAVAAYAELTYQVPYVLVRC